MSFSLGIVGLPNVGKSTLFQALTKNKVEASNYPFCTIDPNVGVVAVPDDRLDKLTKMSQSAKTIPTTIEFVDIAGLVKGASEGEGLGNKFLSHIREVDAIVQVIRYFNNGDVTHVHGKVDPEYDKQIINLELIMADLDTVSKHLDKVVSKMKGPYDKILDKEKVILDKVRTTLEDNKMVNQLEFDEEEKKILKQLNLLTIKPIIYLYNIDESDVNEDLDLPENTIAICAQVEAELAELEETEVKEFLKELGIEKGGLDSLIKTSYKLLNLITFITTGPEETKAWTVTRGAKAPQAAGVIHTDFEKGFIRAEAINWQELLDSESWNNAKDKGLMRMEGKEYIVQDGDTVHFHFN
ncbi:redox-regulated ATPase YchF [Candidatus Parcubacteria bacterium]|jgi:ribosome-binding ATPase|nr:redox-regulated ATPase YchF [Candidatus Parcubacteria bacterium]